MWRFRTGDDMAWAGLALDHGHWDNLISPCNWRRQGYEEYTGMAWYRATFEFDLTAPGMLHHLDSEVKLHTQELSDSNEKLVEAARLDILTGLLNRRGFAEKLEFEICGACVLRETAGLLREQLRDLDSIARWGGEEFIVLLPETGLQGGAVLAEKLRAVVERARFYYQGDILLGLTITIGVAQYHQGMDVDDCLARADHALYQGKEAGRNRVVVEVAAGLKPIKARQAHVSGGTVKSVPDFRPAVPNAYCAHLLDFFQYSSHQSTIVRLGQGLPDRFSKHGQTTA